MTDRGRPWKPDRGRSSVAPFYGIGRCSRPQADGKRVGRECCTCSGRRLPVAGRRLTGLLPGGRLTGSICPEGDTWSRAGPGAG
ncbi:hypothetical protein GCM10010517_33650 [Streptosporangium fragile]|uniref:Uncharacterized protein n=1 Tax=Streptosporangium fragile TaxID=46186 RepID=A0ABP6IGZ5_9ACTN